MGRTLFIIICLSLSISSFAQDSKNEDLENELAIELANNTPETVSIVCKNHSITHFVNGKWGEPQYSYKKHNIIFRLFPTALYVTVKDGTEQLIYRIPKRTKVHFTYWNFQDGGIVEHLWLITSDIKVPLEYNFNNIGKETITIWKEQGKDIIKEVHHVDDAYSSFMGLFFDHKEMFNIIRVVE